MIRKINFVLFMAFLALLGAKAIRNVLAKRMVQPPATAETASSDISTLTPHFYYVNWPGFSVMNPVSNRNGVLLDILRNIFPKATFTRFEGNVAEFAEKLGADPCAAMPVCGAYPKLDQCPRSRTPLCEVELVVLTSRANSWHYEDESSLDALRIGMLSYMSELPLVRRLREKWKDHPERLTVFPSSSSVLEIGARFEDGTINAFFWLGGEGFYAADVSSAFVLQRVRMSKPIAKAPVLLHASGKSPEMSAALLRDYEAGMMRLERTGALRRIREYYSAKERVRTK